MGNIRLTLSVVFLAFFFSAQLVSAQTSFPTSVTNALASREMRYKHFLWHQVRENWNRFSESTKRAFRNIGWEPPRAARRFDSNGNSYSINDNHSGEDFLYMHRQMLAEVNSLLTRSGRSRISGWKTIPGQNDRTWPVSGTYTVPGNPSRTNYINTRKTSSYYTNSIVPAERRFKDPNELRRMSLGEFGARIEVTVHSWLHMRFSSRSSVGYRNGYSGTIPNVAKQWDNPRYDWLGDAYSSHVNPVFWQIHSWIDDRIEDWRRANNLSSIRWRGTWTGGPMSRLGNVLSKQGDMGSMDMSGNSGDDIEVMDEALKIFAESGIPEVSMIDQVFEDDTHQRPPKKRTCRSRRRV